MAKIRPILETNAAPPITRATARNPLGTIGILKSLKKNKEPRATESRSLIFRLISGLIANALTVGNCLAGNSLSRSNSQVGP